MDETTATQGAEQHAARWKCMACGEAWDIVHGDGDVQTQCPECRGPLRLVPSPLPHRDDPVELERALVALSDDQQWLVVHWSGYRTPWTVLRRLEDFDGYGVTGESYEDIGQNAGDILTAFLATQRARGPRLLEHVGAD